MQNKTHPHMKHWLL